MLHPRKGQISESKEPPKSVIIRDVFREVNDRAVGRGKGDGDCECTDCIFLCFCDCDCECVCL